ncbi:LOW QUALITY PROTEIN: hypothetical protein Cgig2_032780 [Carnegiea gigantea]|uniref:Uncharacterized protein n=1 Tax=Carnegiea gigantea TaxID=171969 RepID=A0A9Q1JJA4_9CARY|nr:LOW QUALITY PROTEIN: hypothetical protein Cgig2_032780 [Carnegiea gigantea]
MEAIDSTKPLPTIGCEPSHRHDPAGLLCRSDKVREIARPERNGRSQDRNNDRSVWPPDEHIRRPQANLRTLQLRPHHMQLITIVRLSLKSKRKPQILEKELLGGGALPNALQLGSVHAAQHNPEHAEPREEECSTEVVAAITGGYVEGITPVSIECQNVGDAGSCITVPTMVFDGREGLHFSSPYTDPLVVELKVTNTLVHQIKIDTGSSIEIITGSGIQEGKSFPSYTPFWAIEDKRSTLRQNEIKVQNLEVDFLVVDIPAAYNVILDGQFCRSMKWMMVALESSNGINTQPGSVTLSASGHRWNAQASADLSRHLPRTKGGELHILLL